MVKVNVVVTLLPNPASLKDTLSSHLSPTVPFAYKKCAFAAITNPPVMAEMPITVMVGAWVVRRTRYGAFCRSAGNVKYEGK